MNEPDSPAEAEIELARFRHGEGVEDTCEVLKKAGISYRLSTNLAAFDPSSVGGGGTLNAKGAVIIMVAAHVERQAYEALLADARQTVKNGVEADFHMRQWSDEDLEDVLKAPMEWSAHDVASAESLLRERNVSFKPPSYELPEDVVADRAGKAQRERKGTRRLISRLVLGFVFALAFMILKQFRDETSMRLLAALRIGVTIWVGWLLWLNVSSDQDEEE